jgi:hypothetical protein
MTNPHDPVNINGNWWHYDERTRTHRPAGDNHTRKVAHLEPLVGDEPLATGKGAAFTTLVSLEIISYRTRLADPSGISEKAAIDGLVNCGILRGDSLREIQEPIIHRQVKVKNISDEKTEIIIERVK